MTSELLLAVLFPIIFGFMVLVFNKPLAHFFVGIEQKLGLGIRSNTITITHISYVIVGAGRIAFGVYPALGYLV